MTGYREARPGLTIPPFAWEVFVCAAALDNLAFQCSLPTQRTWTFFHTNVQKFATRYCRDLVNGVPFALEQPSPLISMSDPHRGTSVRSARPAACECPCSREPRRLGHTLRCMDLMEKTLGCVLLISGLLLTTGCAAVRAIETEKCDPQIVNAFRLLPPAEGMKVDLHGSTGIGCTDTVTPSDPEAFIGHYEHVMRNAGWTVLVDGSGVYGRGPSGGPRLDRLEGNDVGVYALSLEEIQSSSG